MTHQPYRREIDGLRAVAVLAVVLYHAGAGPATGFAGVDVFFVISGYLITWLLLREHAAGGRIDLAGFYGRRARRILPAVSAVVVATLYFSRLSLTPEAQGNTLRSAISGILFYANVFFLNNSGGYFDAPSEEMPLLHLWSLAVEEQFYLLWPLLIVFLLRLRAGLTRRAFVLPAALAVLAIASIVFAEYQIRVHPEAAYFLMPARFWELAAGGLVAATAAGKAGTAGKPESGDLLGNHRGHYLGNHRGHYPGNYFGIIGLAAIAAGLALPAAHFPGIGALPVVAGAALLLWLVHREQSLGIAGTFLRFAPLSYIGRISYSLYLWHWPLLAIYRATNVGVTTANCLVLCGIAVMLAALSHRYIETPFRSALPAMRKGRVVALGTAASACLALALFACDRFAVHPGDNMRDADHATQVENDLTPFRAGCKLSPIDPPDKFPPAGCESVRGVSPEVAIWGDSFGTAWQPLAWAIARQAGLSAADYTRYTCPAFLNDFADKNHSREVICRAFNTNVVAKVKGYDTLIIGTRWDFRPLADDEAGLRATLAAVAPRVRKVILIGPSPVMRELVPKCIRANDLGACAISRSEFHRQSEPTRAMLKSLASQYPNVEYLELEDLFCSQSTCSPVKDGLTLYYDDRHVSYSAAQKLAADYVAGAKTLAQ